MTTLVTPETMTIQITTTKTEDELFGSSEETVYVEVEKENDGIEYMSNEQAKKLGLEIPRPDMADEPCACGPCQVRPAKFGWSIYDGKIVLGGYVLASRRGRDYSANCIETLVKGSFGKTGGDYWYYIAHDDSVFGLHVRKDFAIRHGLIESKLALEAERAALVARIAKIDTLLA